MKIYLYIVLGVIFALLLIEIVLEFFNLAPLVLPAYYPDDNLGHVFKPNWEHYNYVDGLKIRIKTVDIGFGNIGFRDDGINGSVYAIAIGDSFTLSNVPELEESWVELLEKRMNKDAVNMGAAGYATTQELHMLKEYGIKLKPKLVLWQFFINDFRDDGTYLKQRNNTNLLFEHSALYRFLWQSIIKIKTVALHSVNYKEDNIDLVFAPDFWINSVTLNEDVLNGEKIAKSNILEAKKLVESNNATFVLIIIPAKEQVYWDKFVKLVDNPEKYKFHYITDSIKQLCVENNILCIDLLPVFEESRTKQIYFRIDGHINEEGNRVVADAIYKFLQEKSVV